MFREVYTQPLSNIRQSSVGGIEKHVSSYLILWSYSLAFKIYAKVFLSSRANLRMQISAMQQQQQEPNSAIRETQMPVSSRIRRKRVSILISITTTTIARTVTTAVTRTSVEAIVEIREGTKAEEEEDKKIKPGQDDFFQSAYPDLIYAIILLQNHSTPVQLKQYIIIKSISS